ncbi:hypothetical protein LZ32DRAFT_436474 [Colletotrichum eremochloae]|nr:hypothetical protein LZ32DRAFT_436474 [Colletotrichum eremochloae]
MLSTLAAAGIPYSSPSTHIPDQCHCARTFDSGHSACPHISAISARGCAACLSLVAITIEAPGFTVTRYRWVDNIIVDFAGQVVCAGADNIPIGCLN